TEPAFNALLKTLEEPPAHVVFVLATTDPRDIPATVLSRVQRFDFRPIAPDALAASLEEILTSEKIPFEPAALPTVVRAADVSHAEGNELRRLGENVTLDEILYVLRAFLDADEAMRESPHPRVELEMATVRTTRRPQPPALEELLKRVDDVAQRLRQGGGGASPAPATAQANLLADEPRPAAPRTP